MKTLLSVLFFALLSTLTTAEEMPSSAPLFAATLSDLDDKPVALAHFQAGGFRIQHHLPHARLLRCSACSRAA